MAKKSTLDMVEKILAEDAKTAEAQQKRVDKGESAGYIGPVGDYRERIEIKKADAGGIIVCWYGPNGSREVVVKEISELTPILEKYFKD